MTSITSPITKGTVQKGRLSTKGLIVILLISIVGGFISSAIIARSDSVKAAVEEYSGWRNLWGWL